MASVYISGPMTGYADWNRPAFHAVAAELRRQGYEVLNPAEVELCKLASWEDYMRVDLVMLTEAHIVVVLPGWHESRGAQLEVTVASQLGIPTYCFSEDGLEEIVIKSELKPFSANVCVFNDRKSERVRKMATTEFAERIKTLHSHCVQAIQENGQDAIVVCKINRKTNAQNRVKLSPVAGAPHGEIVQCGEKFVVGAFKAVEVATWLKRLAEGEINGYPNSDHR